MSVFLIQAMAAAISSGGRRDLGELGHGLAGRRRRGIGNSFAGDIACHEPG